MTENIDNTKKIEKPVTSLPDDDGKTLYNFTRAGIVVRAKNLEEATKLYKQTLKENNKESDNG